MFLIVFTHGHSPIVGCTTSVCFNGYFLNSIFLCLLLITTSRYQRFNWHNTYKWVPARHNLWVPNVHSHSYWCNYRRGILCQHWKINHTNEWGMISMHKKLGHLVILNVIAYMVCKYMAPSKLGIFASNLLKLRSLPQNNNTIFTKQRTLRDWS